MRVLLFLFFFFSTLSAGDFEVLMGKNTPHWRHVQEPIDQEALSRAKAVYDRHQDLRFAAQSVMKIPKVVHFIWLGPRPFPPESVENVRTWMAQNRDWTFKFWTDRPRDPPCHGMETVLIKEYPFPFLGRCYQLSENWGEKSDILRFEILFHQGGAYADHDANCLQPFDALHGAYDFYCCLETPHPPFVGLNVTAGNGLIGSRPGHPIVRRVIELIDERWDELAAKYPGKDGFSKTQIVMERTYIALTYALRKKLDLPGNTDIVLPAAYFFAKKGIKPLYSKHFFADSWSAPKNGEAAFETSTQKALIKIEERLKRVSLIGGIFLSFNLLLMIFGLIFTKKARSL